METKATRRMNRDLTIGLGLAACSVVFELALVKTGGNPELSILPITTLGGVGGVLIKDVIGAITETKQNAEESIIFYRERAKSVIQFGDDTKPTVRR